MGGKILFIILLVSFSYFFAYADPPINEVVQHNENMNSSQLMGNANLEVNATGNGAAVKIITVLPQVDDRIPSDAEGVLWAWKETYESAANCSGYPASISNRSLDMNAYFTFRNQTIEGNLSPSNPIIAVPSGIKELMETANGTEELTVGLNGIYLWEYTARVGNGTITCSGQINVTDSSKFIVESGQASFFLARPALGEQWYENNHFDTLVFSRKSIYKVEIRMDGNESAYARIYEFNVVADPWVGAWHIFSNKTENSSNAEMAQHEISYWANPVAGGGLPFSHLYEVNHTYEGWGPHNLSIEATDFFLGAHAYEKEIFSRKITSGGLSETGEAAGDAAYYRPGIPAQEKEAISHKILPPAAIGMMILLLALGSFWYYKKGGISR